jgi:hypothetical protein
VQLGEKDFPFGFDGFYGKGKKLTWLENDAWRGGDGLAGHDEKPVRRDAASPQRPHLSCLQEKEPRLRRSRGSDNS